MKILVTGGTGLVGSSFKNYEVIRIGSKDYDLTKQQQVADMMKKYQPEKVIHLAARVGGVLGNMTFAGDYFRDNTLMNTFVLEEAKKIGASKVVSLLSTCIYPDQGPFPLQEKDLHYGPPHESNFSYAYSKRMLEVQSRAYRKQYGLNYICAIPNNLYGEHDNFEETYSHVVPALIRKMFFAKQKEENFVKLWGTGEALREFTYSKDIAKIIMLLLEDYNDEEAINIGNTQEISIKYLAELIKKEIGYEGEIVWDTSMPTGQLKKPSDNSKFKELNPDFMYTDIKEGIAETCRWFNQAYKENKIRGL